MNEFEKRIRSRISDLEMLPSRGGRVLAGVSGGADSVCLLLVLAALREDLDFDLRAIHIHHGLRERAGEDLQLTRPAMAWGLRKPAGSSVISVLSRHVWNGKRRGPALTDRTVPAGSRSPITWRIRRKPYFSTSAGAVP